MLSKDITIINGMARTKDSVKTKDSYDESTIYINDKPAKVGTTLMDRNTGNAVKVTYISSDQIGIGGIYYNSSDKRIDSRYYVMDSKTKDSVKTKDGDMYCRPCSSYIKRTDTCRSGCAAESVDAGGYCPFNYEDVSRNDDLQSSCKCYR